MGPVFYVMAILGCGESDTACEPVARVDAQYASVETCTAATADQVMRHSDLLFPVVVAQCTRSDSELAKLMPSSVDLPTPDRRPDVRRASYQPAKRTSI